MGAYKEPHGGKLKELFLSESKADEEKLKAKEVVLTEEVVAPIGYRARHQSYTIDKEHKSKSSPGGVGSQIPVTVLERARAVTKDPHHHGPLLKPP